MKHSISKSLPTLVVSYTLDCKMKNLMNQRFMPNIFEAADQCWTGIPYKFFMKHWIGIRLFESSLILGHLTILILLQTSQRASLSGTKFDIFVMVRLSIVSYVKELVTDVSFLLMQVSSWDKQNWSGGL